MNPEPRRFLSPAGTHVRAIRPRGIFARLMMIHHRFLAAWAIPLVLVAQPFQTDWQRTGAGGGPSEAAPFRVRGTSGQPEAGTMAAGNYRVRSGFWPGFLAHGAGGPQIGKSTIAIFPERGIPETGLKALGQVPLGSSGVTLYWDQNGTMRPLGSARPGADGHFEIQASVPVDAVPGAARLAVFPTAGSLTRDLAWVGFHVDPPAPASIAGVVQNASGASVGAGFRVRLRNQRGDVVAEVATDSAGRYGFAGLAPGGYIVEPLADTYPPQGGKAGSGAMLNVAAKPFEGALNIPPVMLMRAGAIALPGGSYPGPQPVRVGDWTDTPFARLLSIQGKGRPPLTVRLWAEVKRMTMPADWPLVLVFKLLTPDGTVISQHETDTTGVVHPASPHNFSAYYWDVNSFELPPGSLRWRVTAVAKFPSAKASASLPSGIRTLRSSPAPGNEVVAPGAFPGLIWQMAQWEFPVEVSGLGERWFSSAAKDQKLTVTQKNFFELLYKYEGTLPNLPGIGSPLFQNQFDLGFLGKLANKLDLGVKVQESFSNDGGWWGQAKISAELMLLNQTVLGGSRALTGPSGSSLAASTYKLASAWDEKIPDISLPVWTAGLPLEISICDNVKIGGSLGVFLELSGGVVLEPIQVDMNLRLSATVTPNVELRLPAKADLEFLVCGGHAAVTPSCNLGLPIVLDPWKSPPIAWNGLCVTLSASVSASVECCGIEADKKMNLFDPIQIGNCSAPAALSTAPVAARSATPPPHASIAISPLGYAMAVWDRILWQEGVPRRAAPVYSLFDGTRWSDPAPIAGDEFAGWEPQVAFIGPRRVLVTWVHPRAAGQNWPGDDFDDATGSRIGTLSARPDAVTHGFCDVVEALVDGILCGAIKFGAGIVSAAGDVWDSITPWSPLLSGQSPARTDALQVRWQPPTPVIDDGNFHLRPVLAGNPNTSEAVVVWSREQDPSPTQRVLALYRATYANGVWSAPARLDPASNSLDLQPSVRFDRAGQPAVVWVRDRDADLSTAEDRQLIFASRGQAWSVPEPLTGLPDAPWTPSLDFDAENRPVVAFVVPPVDGLSGKRLPADGHFSELHLARRLDRSWQAHPVGERLRAERPILRIGRNNSALLMFRTFGSGQTIRARGDIATAASDLTGAEPDWSIGHFTQGGQVNQRLVAEIHPETGEPIMLWHASDPLRPEVEPALVRQHRSLTPDMAFGPEGITFSKAQAGPGETVDLSVRLINQGLDRFENAVVQFYDREPARGVVPFATQTVRTSLGFGDSALITVPYLVRDRSVRTVHAVADPENWVAESDEENNLASGVFGGVPAPEHVVAAPLPSGAAVRLQWNTPFTDASVKHWIWRAGSDRNWELIGSTAGTEFTDSTAAPGTAPAYQIITREVDSELSSAGSIATVSLPPAGSSTQAEPLPLHVTTFGGAVHLFWNTLPAVQLQSADALTGTSTVWAPVTEGLHAVGGATSCSQAVGPGTRFFRLKRN